MELRAKIEKAIENEERRAQQLHINNSDVLATLYVALAIVELAEDRQAKDEAVDKMWQQGHND